jgi:hypothetical protein
MTIDQIKKQIKQKVQRFCKKCGEYKCVSEFHIKTSKIETQYRFNSPCKKCSAKQKSQQINKDWMLKKKFGITKKQYDQMLIDQEYSCKICKKHIDEFSKDLAVDHCHATNKVRGLLCSPCNTGLGFFRDDVNLMQAAIDYLNQ